MSVVARLGAFAAALVLVFGLAFAVGGAVDPIGQDDTPAEHHQPTGDPDQEQPAEDQPGDGHGGHP